jgi:hypothetical protein
MEGGRWEIEGGGDMLRLCDVLDVFYVFAFHNCYIM